MIKKTRSPRAITKPVQVKKNSDAGKDLEYILLHLPFPLLILDTQGWAVMVNQSFLNLFGMRSADRVIRKFNILKHQAKKAGGELIDQAKGNCRPPILHRGALNALYC